MTLRHIKIFISVCDTGSTTAAARELYIAQPAVSFAIAEMEHFYGQKLFDRVSNRLRITETGKRFLQYARQIVNLFDEMEEEIIHWDLGGSLRVGSGPTLGSYLLPSLVNAFRKKYPDIEVSVAIEQEAQIEQMVMSSKLDFALLSGPLGNTVFKSELLMKDALSFICPSDHPWAGAVISLKQLEQCDFILRDKDSYERKLMGDLLKQQQIRLHIIWQSISCHAMIEAVEKGLGVSVVPLQAAKSSLRDGRISRFFVEGADLKREVFIVYYQNKLLTKPARDFIDMCMEFLSKNIS